MVQSNLETILYDFFFSWAMCVDFFEGGGILNSENLFTGVKISDVLNGKKHRVDLRGLSQHILKMKIKEFRVGFFHLF